MHGTDEPAAPRPDEARARGPAARLLRWLPVLVAAAIVALPIASCATPELGPVDGHLRPCPKSPNCVGSQDPDADHRVDALPLPAPPEHAIARLAEILREQPRVTVLEQTDVYLHAVFTTPLLRFRDDVEFLVDPGAGVLHVRSASRVGYSDLGKNRARVEELRALLLAADGSS